MPLGYIEGVVEAGAPRLHVERRHHAVNAQLLLYLDGAGREVVGGGVGGQDDVAQVFGGDACRGQSLAGGGHRHGDVVLVRGGNAALGNPGALQDPIIIGVHYLFKVLVGQDPLGYVSACTQDADFPCSHGLYSSTTGFLIYTSAVAKRQWVRPIPRIFPSSRVTRPEMLSRLFG